MNALPWLYASALLFGFSSATIAAYTVACVPAKQPNLLGIRGMKRVRALQSNAQFANIEPSLRWSGMQLRRVLSDTTLAAIDRQLVLAGDYWGLLPEEFVALCTLSVGSSLLTSAVYAILTDGGLGTTALVLAVLAGIIPYSRLTAAQETRKKKVNLGLPPVIDLLVLCLSAGLDLPGSLRHVVAKSSNPSDPLIEELGFVLQELHVGKTRKAALTQFAERVPIDCVREFVGAVIQAEEHGNPLARVLQVHAEVSRQQRTVRAEEAASRAGVKMMIPMLMIFAAILIFIIGPIFMSIKGVF